MLGKPTGGFPIQLSTELLAHPKDLKHLLRRHRNAIFHYQESLLNPRFVRLLAQGALHVYWVRASAGRVHALFLRAYLSGLVATDAQRSELQGQVEGILHWYPHREPPQMSSLDRIGYVRGERFSRSTLTTHPPSVKEIELSVGIRRGHVDQWAPQLARLACPDPSRGGH